MKDRIKKIRTDIGYSQQLFAENLNISRNYVCLMESGSKIPGARLISDMCEKFGYSELWLRTGEGDPKEQTLPLDNFQVTMEIIEREMGKAIPNLIKAMAKMYAEANPVDRETMDRLLEELLNNMK